MEAVEEVVMVVVAKLAQEVVVGVMERPLGRTTGGDQLKARSLIGGSKRTAGRRGKPTSPACRSKQYCFL